MEPIILKCPHCDSESLRSRDHVLCSTNIDGWAVEGGRLTPGYGDSGSDVFYDTAEPVDPTTLYECADCLEALSEAELIAQLPEDVRKLVEPRPLPPREPGAQLTPRELGTVLAALRCYQQVRGECAGDVPDDLADIATDGGAFAAMEADEIDDLCERLNVDPSGNHAENGAAAAA